MPIHETQAIPLVVSPRRARQLLDCSHKKIYELLNAGELYSIKIGRARRIVMASITDYVARRLKSEGRG